MTDLERLRAARAASITYLAALAAQEQETPNE
jgi:hypothetical protein